MSAAVGSVGTGDLNGRNLPLDGVAVIAFEVEIFAGPLTLWARAVRGFLDSNLFFRGLPRRRLRGDAGTVMLDGDPGSYALSSGS
jgi:hypothetical protein